jgi:hypothetical protein
MKSRLLKHTRKDVRSLRNNAAHQFAAAHALKIYLSNSIYSFIPKNACSSLRTSLAIANQCIGDAAEFPWIHENNETFCATLEDLVTSRYTFVVLRDPFARLASVYLDKVVSRTDVVGSLHRATGRQVDLEDLTFTGFIAILAQGNHRFINEHWRPQSDFLVYENYDDYFAMERFAEAATVITERAHLPIIDARPLTKHGIGSYRLLAPDEDFSAMPAFEIRRLQRDGQCPHPRSLYREETIRKVAQLYAPDIHLYTNKTGCELMFSATQSI